MVQAAWLIVAAAALRSGSEKVAVAPDGRLTSLMQDDPPAGEETSAPPAAEESAPAGEEASAPPAAEESAPAGEGAPAEGTTPTVTEPAAEFQPAPGSEAAKEAAEDEARRAPPVEDDNSVDILTGTSNTNAAVGPMQSSCEKAETKASDLADATESSGVSLEKMKTCVEALVDAREVVLNSLQESRIAQVKLAAAVPVVEILNFASQAAAANGKDAAEGYRLSKKDPLRGATGDADGLPSVMAGLAKGRTEDEWAKLSTQAKEAGDELYANEGEIQVLKDAVKSHADSAKNMYIVFQDCDVVKMPELDAAIATDFKQAEAAYNAAVEAYNLVRGQPKDKKYTKEDSKASPLAITWGLNKKGPVARPVDEYTGKQQEPDETPVEDTGRASLPSSFVQFDDYDEGEDQASDSEEDAEDVQAAEEKGEEQEDTAADKAEGQAEAADVAAALLETRAAASSLLQTAPRALLQKDKASFDDYDEQPDEAQAEETEAQDVQAAAEQGEKQEEQAEETTEEAAGKEGEQEAKASVQAPTAASTEFVSLDANKDGTISPAEFAAGKVASQSLLHEAPEGEASADAPKSLPGADAPEGEASADAPKALPLTDAPKALPQPGEEPSKMTISTKVGEGPGAPMLGTWSTNEIFTSVSDCSAGYTRVSARHKYLAEEEVKAAGYATNCTEAVAKLTAADHALVAAQKAYDAQKQESGDAQSKLDACTAGQAGQCDDEYMIGYKKAVELLDPLTAAVTSADGAKQTQHVVAVEYCRQSVEGALIVQDKAKEMQTKGSDAAVFLAEGHKASTAYADAAAAEQSAVLAAIQAHKPIFYNSDTDEFEPAKAVKEEEEEEGEPEMSGQKPAGSLSEEQHLRADAK